MSRRLLRRLARPLHAKNRVRPHARNQSQRHEPRVVSGEQRHATKLEVTQRIHARLEAPLVRFLPRILLDARQARPDPRDKTANPRARPRRRRSSVPRHRIFRTRRVRPLGAPPPQADAHAMEEHRLPVHQQRIRPPRPRKPAAAIKLRLPAPARPSTRLHCKRARRLRRNVPGRPCRRPGRHGPTGSVFWRPRLCHRRPG